MEIKQKYKKLWTQCSKADAWQKTMRGLKTNFSSKQIMYKENLIYIHERYTILIQFNRKWQERKKNLGMLLESGYILC